MGMLFTYFKIEFLYDPTLDNIDVIDSTATSIYNKVINFMVLNNLQM